MFHFILLTVNAAIIFQDFGLAQELAGSNELNLTSSTPALRKGIDSVADLELLNTPVNLTSDPEKTYSSSAVTPVSESITSPSQNVNTTPNFETTISNLNVDLTSSEATSSPTEVISDGKYTSDNSSSITEGNYRTKTQPKKSPTSMPTTLENKVTTKYWMKDIGITSQSDLEINDPSTTTESSTTINEPKSSTTINKPKSSTTINEPKSSTTVNEPKSSTLSTKTSSTTSSYQSKISAQSTNNTTTSPQQSKTPAQSTSKFFEFGKNSEISTIGTTESSWHTAEIVKKQETTYLDVVSLNSNEINSIVTLIISEQQYSLEKWKMNCDLNFRNFLIESLNNFEVKNSTNNKRSISIDFEKKFGVFYIIPTPVYRYEDFYVSILVKNYSNKGFATSANVIIDAVHYGQGIPNEVIGGKVVAILPGLASSLYASEVVENEENRKDDLVSYIYVLLFGVFFILFLNTMVFIYIQCQRQKRKYRMNSFTQIFRPQSVYKTSDIAHEQGLDLSTDMDCTKEESFVSRDGTDRPNSRMYKMSEYNNWVRPLNDSVVEKTKC